MRVHGVQGCTLVLVELELRAPCPCTVVTNNPFVCLLKCLSAFSHLLSVFCDTEFQQFLPLYSRIELCLLLVSFYSYHCFSVLVHM